MSVCVSVCLAVLVYISVCLSGGLPCLRTTCPHDLLYMSLMTLGLPRLATMHAKQSTHNHIGHPTRTDRSTPILQLYLLCTSVKAKQHHAFIVLLAGLYLVIAAAELHRSIDRLYSTWTVFN